MKSTDFIVEGDDKNIADIQKHHPEIHMFLTKLVGSMALASQTKVEAYNTHASHMIAIKITPSAGIGNTLARLKDEGVPHETNNSRDMATGELEGGIHWVVDNDGVRGNSTQRWRFALPLEDLEQGQYKDRTMEGDVIKHKFGQKQAQKGKDKYKFNAEFAAEIPKWDPVGKRNIPSGVNYPDVDDSKLVPYDKFEVGPTRSGKSAHIIGVYDDGEHEYKVKTSATTIAAAETLVDMYNRGGFSDKDIQKVEF